MSVKILRIGDPHFKPGNIEECESLMHFISDTISELRPDKIEILGDLFHTHAVVRLEVLEFWDGWIDTLLSYEKDLYILIGNHDRMTTDEHSYSALHMFRHIRNKHLKLIMNPRVDGIFGYVSWYNNPDTFVEVANACAKEGAKVLVCHQTFDGSKYENGFFAPDGIDAKRINIPLIISGHIHTAQDIEKDGQRIIYCGTPKWDTASDANLNKGVWLYEHDDNTGSIISKKLISTESVVKPILEFTWAEGTPMPAIPGKADVTIELLGTSSWIDKMKGELKGRVAIRSKPTDRGIKKERQAGKSFPRFVAEKFETRLDRIKLLKYMKEKKIV
jgi:Calcineurin-like phosphoesterase